MHVLTSGESLSADKHQKGEIQEVSDLGGVWTLQINNCHFEQH